MTRRMPKQRPRRSVQVVRTPDDFLAACRRRFGPIVFDLAANKRNSACGDDFLGPGSTWHEDALDPGFHWAGAVGSRGWGWLNPPFEDIDKWARRCVEESERGLHVMMLVPAAVGSRWFNRWVRPYAYVLELTPRLRFVSHAHAYPKDLVLCIFSPERLVGRRAWDWTETDRLKAGAIKRTEVQP